MPELASVTNIKAYAGIAGMGDDALLADLVDRAEAMIRQYCNRPGGWSDAAFTEVLDGAGINTFLVRNTPVLTSPAPVVTIFYGTTGVVVPASTYRYNAATGEFRYTGGYTTGVEYASDDCAYWPEGFQNIQVEYTGGYTTIPLDLEQAAIEATLWLYRIRKTDPTMQSETIGAYSYTKAATPNGPELPPTVQVLLSPYRKLAGLPE